MEISEIIKNARIKKGMTQQQLADSVFVTRQTISKWELGKSIPDEASLRLLYQCLEINNEEKKRMKELVCNKQNILLLILALLISPAVIIIRFCIFKIGKLEDRRFKIWMQCIGFVLFVLYLRSLKDFIAYFFISITAIGFWAYQYYMLSLERNEKK